MSDERCKLLQHCTPNGIIIIVKVGAGSPIIMACGVKEAGGDVRGARVVWQMGK